MSKYQTCAHSAPWQPPIPLDDEEKGYPVGRFGRQLLADDGRGAFCDGVGDEVVPVGLRAAGGEETVAPRHGPRIVGQGGHRRGTVAVQHRDGRIFE